MTLSRRSPESYVIEPYIIDRAPAFYILGGLVSASSRGSISRSSATTGRKRRREQLVYFDRQQNELFKDGPRRSSSSAASCRADRPSATKS